MNESQLKTTRVDEREQAFRQYKESGEQMVHRLRDWSEGQIVWGLDVIGDGGSSGKTWTREGIAGRTRQRLDPDEDISDINTGHEEARTSYETRRELMTAGRAMFLWVARVQSVRTEPAGPDPGEPSLTFAELDSVQVLESEYGGDDDA